jgi:Zn-dependent protease with chaperone function
MRMVGSVRAGLRLPAAIVTALVVAEAAVVLMRPRDVRPEPVPVEARAYFSQATLARAKDFRSGQRWIFLGSLVVEGGVLAWLVWRPPGALLTPRRRPVLAGAAAAAAVSLTLTAAGLPLSALARQRSIDVGLTTQSWAGWAGDVAKSAAIGTVIAAAGGALLVFGMRRFGRRWWLPGALVVFAFGVFTVYAGPVVLDPVFNKFTPLDQGHTRDTILRLAREAGLKVDRVYVVDASRRTTASNAYVTGLGSTKRVVIYDNLLEDFKPSETRFVVAHELGHVHYDDVPHGLLYLAIVAPFGMLAVALLAEKLGAQPDQRAIPATALAIAVLVPAVSAISNQLSRGVEARADAFALRLTHEPQTLIGFEKQIVERNVADPDPPEVWHALFDTHPTALQRIGMAKAALER